MIWQDKNGNHQTDAGELKTLTDWGITELNTQYTNQAQEQNGNLLLERSNAIGAFGKPIDMVDVYFQVKANQAQQVSPFNPNGKDQSTSRPDANANNVVTIKAGVSITVTSVLPRPQPIDQRQVGITPQPFAQRAAPNSILLGKPVPFKWFDESDDESESSDAKASRSGDIAPVIDWGKEGAIGPKRDGQSAASKSGTRPKSDWVAGFVSGQDDKANQGKLNALKITLPTALMTKGK